MSDNVNILKITFKSVKRRYRQIIRAGLTTLLAVFFVTAVLKFQEICISGRCNLIRTDLATGL